MRRLEEHLGRDQGAIVQAGSLRDLASTQAAEIREALTRDQAASLKAAAREASSRQPGGPGLRSRSLAEAERRGIDLEQLRSAQRAGRRQLDDLLHGATTFSPGEITVRSLEAPFDWPPMVEPPVAVSTVFQPPFADGWSGTTISEATGDGAVSANDSYLDPPWGRLGTRMVGRNHDAGDDDWLNVFHQSGFIVPVTMPSTSTLHVTADLTCLVCEHTIATSDEWGWSDFFAVTQSGVRFAVFWEHDDGEPLTEDFRQRFVPGLDASGDGESHPGTNVVVGPGERRSVSFLSTVAFPAGKTVWVYVGMSDFMYARINDVSIDISMDSAWQLSSLTVTAL
jgi:hypothetical protein